jgi:GxxExxY protein
MRDQNLALKHHDLTEKIIGVYFDVYNELGYGFLEAVYQSSLIIALSEAGLKAKAQVPIPVFFHGQVIGEYRADLLVEDVVIVELKSARTLDSSHEAQLLHYLKATEIEVGLLLNFGVRPQFRRFLFDNLRKKIRVNPCESVAGVLV